MSEALETVGFTRPKIRALAPWFGGKRTMAPAIVEELGTHTQYFEPFVGGCSILFFKPIAQKETVCDLHGDLTNLARVCSVIETAEQLWQRLSIAVMSDGLVQDARAFLEASEPSDEADIDRAFWYFIASWMCRNGTAGTARMDYQLAVRWTKSGGSPVIRFRNAVDSIPQWHRRLQNVVICRRNAFEIIDRFEDCKETAIYADPPYAIETRSMVDKKASSGSYKHEFRHSNKHDALGALFGAEPDIDDHERLARAMRAYKHARIVVSAYDCPRYRELFEGWTFVSHTTTKRVHAQNGRGAPVLDAPEVLIINGPSLAKEHNDGNPDSDGDEFETDQDSQT